MDSDPQVKIVSIDFCLVETPVIKDKLYTGEKQTADVPESSWYQVTKNDGGTEVGTYEVLLTLTDTKNSRWKEEDGSELPLKFSILPVESNAVTVSIEGWTYGEAANQPTATATAGVSTAVFTYAKTEEGEYTATVPSEAGTWYVKATVPATSDYAAGEAITGFEIAKAKPEVTAPGVLTLKYSGEAQELVSAGSAKSGEILYALGTETAFAAGQLRTRERTGSLLPVARIT